MLRITGLPPVDIRGPAPLPLVGAHLGVLRFFRDPVGAVLALRRDYGEIAAVIDRRATLVCAFGAERNREVLSNQATFQHVEGLPFRPPPGSALERLNHALVFMNGETHRRHRRLMMGAFTRSAVDGYAPDVIATTARMLDRWPRAGTTDVAALLRELTLCVAVRCLFGLDIAGGAEALGRLAVDLLDTLGSPLTMALPFDVPGTPFRRALRLGVHYEARLRALIDARRRDLASTDAMQPTDSIHSLHSSHSPPGSHSPHSPHSSHASGARTRDALSLLIAARDDDGARFSDDELVGEANTLLIAGHETTSSTLGFTLLLLALHPPVLADLLDEIDGVLRGAPPTLDDVPRLPLVDRVIRESMRLLPAAPLLFLRSCTADAPLGPHLLPRGAAVVLSPLVTHRDPDRFPDPARFHPARWDRIDPSPYEYLPYGTGPRMCLGAGFANLALRLILPQILTRFHLALAPRAHLSRVAHGPTIALRHGLPMAITARDRSTRDGARPRPQPPPADLRGDMLELIDLS